MLQSCTSSTLTTTPDEPCKGVRSFFSVIAPGATDPSQVLPGLGILVRYLGIQNLHFPMNEHIYSFVLVRAIERVQAPSHTPL